MKNPTAHRFVPKTFGYGLVPISRQGWIVSIILTGLCVLSAYSNNLFTSPELSPQQGVRFIIDIVILSFLFVILMKDKTDGEIKRRRGQKD